jgi:hypothetical protein
LGTKEMKINCIWGGNRELEWILDKDSKIDVQSAFG